MRNCIQPLNKFFPPIQPIRLENRKMNNAADTRTDDIRVAIVCSESEWIGPHNTAKALKRAGVKVCAVAPADSYIAQSIHLAAKLLVDARTLHQSLPAVLDCLVDNFDPTLLLAGDDKAFTLLAGYAANGEIKPAVRQLLGRSFPDRNILDRFHRESDFIANFATLPCTPPPSVIQPTWPEVLQFAEEYGFPFMFKKDGYNAGCGVSVCTSLAQAEALFAAMNGCRFLIQQQIAGEACQVIVSGYAGQAKAALGMRKIEVCWENGPSSVLQFLAHEQMQVSAQRIYEQCGLSGFAGIDFMLDRENRAWLLELNPRIVPATHLGHLFGVDLIGALVTAINGAFSPLVTTRKVSTVTLFPNECVRNPSSSYLYEGYHDVPWDDPGVLKTIIHRIIRAA